MANSAKMPSYFDEEVKLIAYCPFCEADLNPIKAKIVESREDMHWVHFQCNKCRGFILAVVLRTVNGLNSIGLITDLHYNEVFKFKEVPSISADEVLNIYQSLQQKDLVKKMININK